MSDGLTIAFLLWDGHVGGAERHTVELAATIESLGLARTAVVFVDSGQPVLGAVAATGRPVTAVEFNLGRGRNLLLHKRRPVAILQRLGVDVLFAPLLGFIGLALRAGGYSGALIGVEHGAMLNPDVISPRRRWVHARSLATMASLFDSYVAVSDVMAERVREALGPPFSVATVHNGVDTTRYVPNARRVDDGTFCVGVAARLVPGKGVREAILALEPHLDGCEVRLRVAGDGPMRSELEDLARSRGVLAGVEFMGMVSDMPAFWRGCDIAVHAANGWQESFCLAVAEAQACGLPAVVSRAGALPSVVADGQTGIVLEPGDIDGLRRAIALYAGDEQLRVAVGAAARSRACRMFSLDRAARDYVGVACDLLDHRQTEAGRR